MEVTGAIQAIGDQDGATLDGDILDTGDLATDTITTLTATEEEVQPLIMVEETMLTIETTLLTEATTATEITPIETTPQIEVVTQQTEMGTLTLEEVLQTEEPTTLLARLLQTEEVMLREAIVTTTLTEDRAATQQPEITIAVITTHQQEATLLAHHVL